METELTSSELIHQALDQMGWPRDKRKGVPVIIEGQYVDVTDQKLLPSPI